MSRLWSLFLSMLLLVALGAAQLPRPCMGDGEGNACRPEACACIASCTCHLDHMRAREAASMCCSTDAAVACHGPEQPAHVALPEKEWQAMVPSLPGWTLAFWPPASRHTPWEGRRIGHPDLLLPEKPPRLLV